MNAPVQLHFPAPKRKIIPMALTVGGSGRAPDFGSSGFPFSRRHFCAPPRPFLGGGGLPLAAGELAESPGGLSGSPARAQSSRQGPLPAPSERRPEHPEPKSLLRVPHSEIFSTRTIRAFRRRGLWRALGSSQPAGAHADLRGLGSEAGKRAFLPSMQNMPQTRKGGGATPSSSL